MIGSISSNSNYWYQKTENLAKLQKSSESTITADTLITGEEKAARNKNLSLMDIMGLMQNSKAAKQEEITEDSEESFSSATDTDGDGVISAEEYEAFVTNNNITDALSADDFFNLYDADKDGKISTDEVKQGAANAGIEDKPKAAPPKEEGLPSGIDIDGDGSLSKDEYENLVSSLGLTDAPDTDEFFSKYDTNGDGEISADEANAVLSEAAGARFQAVNAYESNYRYLEDEDSSEWSSIV
ncbi:EF-hand domain-containing protein [Anaerocolumna xylanovorans]|uniref:EF hand n=1 Tax=Anaerocolumna xylanovorans DSM 12503 TaxID=1121345 RepID=A0A1M7XZC4_9FIRM|nr:EF-hand domain-containing protein [Anaerocolumna xylanovorans]SHO44528.1 EF hand [Anaerocolumna xylanovorans DSM 12503]